MTSDPLMQLFLVLATLATIGAGMIGTLKAMTSLSVRAVSVLSIAAIVGLAVLAQASGFLPMIQAQGSRGMLIAGAWGLAAALGGHGLTSQSALSALKRNDA
jgi:hypothetical protein